MGFLNAIPGAMAQGLIWGLFAIGLYISYKILDIADLTVDGSICTGACVLAILLSNGVNVFICMIAAFVAGALAGVVTGLFHTVMGIPAILSGILTQLILWSLNLKILGKANLAISARKYSVLLSSMDNWKAIVVSAIFCILVIVGLYLFFYTEVGFSIKATGDNENMSRAQGVNVNLNKVIGLAISNGIIALSGALLAQYQGFADINMGFCIRCNHFFFSFQRCIHVKICGAILKRYASTGEISATVTPLYTPATNTVTAKTAFTKEPVTS